LGSRERTAGRNFLYLLYAMPYNSSALQIGPLSLETPFAFSEQFPPVAFAMVCLACFICVLCACAYLPPYPPEAKVTRSITELWEPVYKPDFAFESYQARSEPVGYTVGIIALDFSYDIMPRGEWVMTSLEEEYRKGFIDAFSESLKKILTAKGMDVMGPYASYDDITFIDRSRCDFIMLPKLSVEFEPMRSTLIEELPDFGGPYGEPLIYGRSGDRLDARARHNRPADAGAA